MIPLPERIAGTMPDLEAREARELFQRMRRVLFAASNEGRLQGGQAAIERWVRLDHPPPKVTTDPRARAIVGGLKDFDRRPESACLVRDDGAWIHFTVTVIEGRKRTDGLVLFAYDFEIVFADHEGDRHPAFVRIDLNTPDHPNAMRDLRSHLHPGHDDLQVPAPILAPEEALDLMVNGFR